MWIVYFIMLWVVCLVTCTIHKLALSVQVLARYMSNPMTDHWKAAKSILQCVLSIVDHGIWCSRGHSAPVVDY